MERIGTGVSVRGLLLAFALAALAAAGVALWGMARFPLPHADVEVVNESGEVLRDVRVTVVGQPRSWGSVPPGAVMRYLVRIPGEAGGVEVSGRREGGAPFDGRFGFVDDVRDTAVRVRLRPGGQVLGDVTWSRGPDSD